MRRYIVTFLVLFLTMTSVPLPSAFADQSDVEHTQTMSMDGMVDQNLADCCNVPMSSMHHGSMPCSMDCSAIAVWATGLNVDNDVQFLRDVARNHVTETTSSHFRPPIFV